MKNFVTARSRRLVPLLALALMASPAFATNSRYIISGASPDRIGAEVRREGGRPLKTLKYHKGAVAELPDAAVAALQRKLGDRVKIERDHEVQVQGKPTSKSTAQPVQTRPWGINMIHAPEAWSVSRGTGIKVCVVDTGVQKTHPDLAANIAGGENLVVIKGRVDPALYEDDNGHGTHVSGTIAALDNGIGVVGVAPEAKIFAVKALNRRGSGYLSDIAEGIRSCIANGTKVINLSLGSAGSASLLADAISDAIAAGIIVIAASGNESTSVSYPAKYPGVVAVSAVDSSLKLGYFSNTGAEIQFAGPGVDVRSTVKGSAYATYSGTSMASPHVAGVAALAVASRSLRLQGTDIGLPADQQGQGLIDALKTVQNR
jgi:subtilisin family serine protease